MQLFRFRGETERDRVSCFRREKLMSRRPIIIYYTRKFYEMKQKRMPFSA